MKVLLLKKYKTTSESSNIRSLIFIKPMKYICFITFIFFANCAMHWSDIKEDKAKALRIEAEGGNPSIEAKCYLARFKLYPSISDFFKDLEDEVHKNPVGRFFSNVFALSSKVKKILKKKYEVMELFHSLANEVKKLDRRSSISKSEISVVEEEGDWCSVSEESNMFQHDQHSKDLYDFTITDTWSSRFATIDMCQMGRFFSELVFANDFYCFTVPEISEFIYRLARISILDGQNLNTFISCFMKELTERRESVDEEKIRNKLLVKFGTVNLGFFFNLKNEVAFEFITLVKDNTDEFISEFSEIYCKMIVFIKAFDMRPEIDEEASKDKLKAVVKSDIIPATKEVGVLVLMYSLSILTSTITQLIPGFANFILNREVITPYANDFEEKIRIRMKLTGQTFSKEIQKTIKNKEFNVKTPDLLRFSDKVHKVVVSSDSCDVCKADNAGINYMVVEKHKHLI